MCAEVVFFTEIIAVDPALLSGVSIHSFMTDLIVRFGINWVELDDVEGAVQGLANRNSQVMPAAESLDRVGQAHQYDWAFFYLFVARPIERKAIEPEYKTRLIDADLTVRLVDSAFIFIYSRNDGVPALLMTLYPAAKHRLVEINDLQIAF